MLEEKSCESFTSRRRITGGVLELEAAAGNEKVADVMLPVVLARPAGFSIGALRVARHRDGQPRDVRLGFARALRQLLDRVSVAIARRKVHRRIRPRRVVAEDPFDDADTLE